MKLTVEVSCDDHQLVHALREVLSRLESSNPGSSVSATGSAESRRAREHDVTEFFVSSKHPADLLVVVEAPDPNAGARNEPHWLQVQRIRPGDRIWFRSSRDRALIGFGYADRLERGMHRRDPGTPAVRWWIRDARRFETLIPDAEFARLFKKYDNGSAGFELFQSDGNRFSQKTYCYPLTKELGEALEDAGSFIIDAE